MDLTLLPSDHGYMFAPYCSHDRSRVLLGFESVVDVEQTPFGTKVLLRCHCGELLAHDSTPGASSATRTGGRTARCSA
jgi:hypothetical protein